MRNNEIALDEIPVKSKYKVEIRGAEKRYKEEY